MYARPAVRLGTAVERWTGDDHRRWTTHAELHRAPGRADRAATAGAAPHAPSVRISEAAAEREPLLVPIPS